MSAAREAILARMRHALGRSGKPEREDSADAARRAVEERLANPAPPLIPARGDLDLEGRIALFTRQAEAVQASVLRIAAHADLPLANAD
jgi:L-lactate dehydrogenase complex protein LldG